MKAALDGLDAAESGVSAALSAAMVMASS